MSADHTALGHIGVLMGGTSSEREISLKSGKAVASALKDAGCHVFPIEIVSEKASDIKAQLAQKKIDVAFIAMHGRFGEDGALQAILEKMGMPYTGSSSDVGRLAMNKIATQTFLREKGINVPAHYALQKSRSWDPQAVFKTLGGFPLVVKPAAEGSSIGITLVKGQAQFEEALKTAWGYGPEALIERYIPGREITAGILNQTALPLVEIKCKNDFFDFTSKYQKGMTDYVVPAELSGQTTEDVQQTALKIFRLLGCRDFARLDFILDGQDRPFFLEANTIPGFTAMSLLPMAARAAGYDFEELCLKIVQLALGRKGKHRVQQYA